MRGLPYIDRIRLAKARGGEGGEPDVGEVALAHARAATKMALDHHSDHPVVAAQKHAAAVPKWKKVQAIAALKNDKQLHAKASNMIRGHEILSDRKAHEFAPTDEIKRSLYKGAREDEIMKLAAEQKKDDSRVQHSQVGYKGHKHKPKFGFSDEDRAHHATDPEVQHHAQEAERHLSMAKKLGDYHHHMMNFHHFLGEKRKHEIGHDNQAKSENWPHAQWHAAQGKAHHDVAHAHYKAAQEAVTSPEALKEHYKAMKSLYNVRHLRVRKSFPMRDSEDQVEYVNQNGQSFFRLNGLR